MAQEGLPILLKLMREGNQSKQVVAETIIAMGPQGEAQLIALIKNHHQNSRLLNNNKAKECIIKALALSNIENPNIDFVIEALFYAYAKEQNATLRRAAIMSLDILHKKSQRLQDEQSGVANMEPNGSEWKAEYAARNHFNTYL